MVSKRKVAFPNYIVGPAAARPSAEGLPNNVIYASAEGYLSRVYEGAWVALGPTLTEFTIHAWHEPAVRSAWPKVRFGVPGARYDAPPAGATPGYVEWSLKLPAGTYECLVQYYRATNAGIGEVRIDGNTFGTWDGYGSAAVVDVALPTTRVVTEGLHTIRLAKTGTKASGTDYYVLMSQITLIKL